MNRILVAVAVTTLTSSSLLAYKSHKEDVEKAELVNFVDYCMVTEGLIPADTAKDYSKASLHDLKSVARFYIRQDNFLDVTDYSDMEDVYDIVGVK